ALASSLPGASEYSVLNQKDAPILPSLCSNKGILLPHPQQSMPRTMASAAHLPLEIALAPDQAQPIAQNVHSYTESRAAAAEQLAQAPQVYRKCLSRLLRF